MTAGPVNIFLPESRKKKKKHRDVEADTGFPKTQLEGQSSGKDPNDDGPTIRKKVMSRDRRQRFVAKRASPAQTERTSWRATGKQRKRNGQKGGRNEEEEVVGSWREGGQKGGRRLGKERAFALGVVRVQRRRDAWWKMATRPILFIDVRFTIIARPS